MMSKPPPATHQIAYEPELVPPVELMRREQIDVLEEWFRWAEETSPSFMPTSRTRRNPGGRLRSDAYVFPYPDESFDLVYAASVFTHLLPAGAASYFNQTRRILRPAGRAVFSVFLLDFYRPGHWRPPGFDSRYFDFDHVYEDYGDDFAIVDEANPEETTAYRLQLLECFASDAGLRVVGPALAGMWSATAYLWVGSQDLLVLERAVNRKRRRLPKRLRASITER